MKSRYLSKKEIECISSHANRQNALIIWTAEATGLRVGDLVKIRADDLQEQPPGIRYRAQKTGKVGFAPISPILGEILRKNARFGWVFPSPKKRGEHITRQAVWKAVKCGAIRGGVAPAGASPHSMRKTFGANTARARGIAAAREALQHSDVATTQIYTMSDWLTGENAEEPLRRKDLPMILEEMALYLNEKKD